MDFNLLLLLFNLISRATGRAICDSLDLTLGASPSQAPPSERGKLLAAENRKKLCMWQGVGLGSTLIEPIRQRGKLNFFEHFLTIL